MVSGRSSSSNAGPGGNHPDRSSSDDAGAESARLDQAIRRADQLLVQSLQGDE